MRNEYCAVHGLLIVDQSLNAKIIGREFELQISDLQFLDFIVNKAPFVYEIEGPRVEPPIFEFPSTVIALRNDVDAGTLQNILYCASSREDRFDSSFSSWVAFEYHRFMPKREASLQLVRDNSYENRRLLRGLLAFCEKFSGERHAVFVEASEDLLEPVIILDKTISSKLISFVMHNDRHVISEDHDFSSKNVIMNLFVRVDEKRGQFAAVDDEDSEFDRFGLVFAEIELINEDAVDCTSMIAQMLMVQNNYLVRWQQKCPSTMKQFLESRFVDAPSVIVPYIDGGSGSFNFWYKT